MGCNGPNSRPPFCRGGTQPLPVKPTGLQENGRIEPRPQHFRDKSTTNGRSRNRQPRIGFHCSDIAQLPQALVHIEKTAVSSKLLVNQANDRNTNTTKIQGNRGDQVIADRGYDAPVRPAARVGRKPHPAAQEPENTDRIRRSLQTRNIIERMFNRLKDWRQLSCTFRCSETFLAAAQIAATVIWLLRVYALTTRMHAPFHSLNVFSKIENHRYAVALHVMYYNFVRRQDYGLTSAMAASVSDRLGHMSISALVEKQSPRLVVRTLQEEIQTSCLLPRFDGVILSLAWKEALCTVRHGSADPPLSEQQYSDRKLRSRS